MKLLRLQALIFSLSLRRTLTHRVNLVFDLGQSAILIATLLVTILAIYQQTEFLAGWSRAELLILTGIFVLVSGLRATFIDPSLTRFVTSIRDGTLDEALLRPAPSWFTTTFREHAPLALSQAVLGLGVIAAGLVGLDDIPRVPNVIVAIVLVAAAVVLSWSLSLIIASMGFWAARFELAPLTGSLWDIGRYPTNVYGDPIRTVVGYVIPVAGMITLPSTALTHEDPHALLLVGLALTFVFVGLALVMFRYGLRRYTGATS